MKTIIKLIAKIEGLINTTEYRSVKLHGVSCSRADLEIIKDYTEKYLQQGNINGFMQPCGNVKEVFDKLNIKFN